MRIQLEKVAKLELKQVNMEGGIPGAGGKTLAQRVHEGEEIVPGFKAYALKYQDSEGSSTSTLRWTGSAFK